MDGHAVWQPNTRTEVNFHFDAKTKVMRAAQAQSESACLTDQWGNVSEIKDTESIMSQGGSRRNERAIVTN